MIPLGKAEVKREGTDISLIAHGRCAILCLEAAEALASEHGINAEVVDLRSIRPLDEEAILESVKRLTERSCRRKQTLLWGRSTNLLYNTRKSI